MTSLTDLLLADDRRPNAVRALVEVVDAEVKGKRGLSGTAVKAAYATARKVSPTMAQRAIDKMLPDFAAALDPHWADFGGQGDFGSFLAGRSEQVSAALLAVTDARVDKSSKEVLKKAYRSIRGKAKENVVEALPRVGGAIAGVCR